MIMLGGYSYLGLLGNREIELAAIQAVKRYGTGTHGVRLLAGTLPIHTELEEAIANLKGCESAVVLSSGYLTNLSAISSLVGSLAAYGILLACTLAVFWPVLGFDFVAFDDDIYVFENLRDGPFPFRSPMPPIFVEVAERLEHHRFQAG